MMTRREHLDDSCNRAGLYVRTWSPGDGQTRYRFFKVTTCAKCGAWRGPIALDDHGTCPDFEVSDYFGPENGVYTALGLKEAFAFVNGALAVKA